MTGYIIIALVSLFGAGLTLFSGFGLGTILMPVFAAFFPVDVAIALTAIVHLLNNVFKLLLLGRKADLQIVLRFGLPSIIAALAGAWLLSFISGAGNIAQYTIGSQLFVITPVKLIVALLLLLFVILELHPGFKNRGFDKKYMPLGGLLSGFFGGLSGNQGALRSAFLLKAGLSKESFIATGVAIACLIDISRLAVYSSRFLNHEWSANLPLLLTALIPAFIGSFLGSKLLKKVSIKLVHVTVSVLLIVFAALLGLGII
jgi:uncharacterized membrane protein YfcA